MRITSKAWKNYITLLRRVSDRAAKELESYIWTQSNRFNEGIITYEEYEHLVIEYAYAITTKYGEAAGAAACDMYDAIAELQQANVAAAIPAQTATYGEVAKSVLGTIQTDNPSVVASATGRLVKMVSLDTMQQNALRDGAEWAWIPVGETCAFCLTLASNGWQKASKKAIKNGHAEHVHSNCDCTFAVRFKPNLEVEGSNNGEKYLDMYRNAPLREDEAPTSKNRINALRRQFYAENKSEEINVNL